VFYSVPESGTRKIWYQIDRHTCKFLVQRTGTSFCDVSCSSQSIARCGVVGGGGGDAGLGVSLCH